MGQPLDGVRDPYNPLFDPSVPAEDALLAFNTWVSGYYAHGSTPDTLERRSPLAQPPPTISTIAPYVLPELVCMGPGARGASDGRLLAGALRTGLFRELRERALYLNDPVSAAHLVGDDWRDIEVRFVWGMQSSWEVQYTRLLLLEQLEDAREQGRTVRNVRHVCVQGNHFVCLHFEFSGNVTSLTGRHRCIGTTPSGRYRRSSGLQKRVAQGTSSSLSCLYHVVA